MDTEAQYHAGADEPIPAPSGMTKSRQLIVDADASFATGDTSNAVDALRTAVEHPDADLNDLRDAARMLSRFRGHEDQAADAYLRALAHGLPAAEWDTAAAALDRAGRRDQAQRLRALNDRRQ